MRPRIIRPAGLKVRRARFIDRGTFLAQKARRRRPVGMKFKLAMEYLLRKNAELYRRLALDD